MSLPTKQVIVIRRDLGMRRGKEIAQGSHASSAWLTHKLRNPPPPWKRCLWSLFASTYRSVSLSAAERAWLAESFRKITCQVSGLEELMAVAAAADAAGVACHMITDAGLTQFAGVPTVTCLAVGPDYDDRIDPVTGHLKLY
jgi:PTH2 family peptidyl-tRNA hydrolase